MTSKQIVSTVAAQKRKLRSDIKDAESKYQDAESRYHELEATMRRKFKGNGRNLERAFAQLRELGRSVGELKDDMSRLNRLNPDDFVTPAQLEKALEGHRASIDIHKANADKQWAELKGTVDQHSTSIHMLQEGQSSLNTRFDKLEKRVKHTTTSTAGGGGALTLVAVLVAVIAGVVAGLIWHSNDFKDLLKIPYSGDVPFVYTFANTPWAAILFGVAVGSFILGLLLLVFSFLRPRSTKETTKTTSTTTSDTTATPATTRQPVVAKRGDR